MEPSFTYREACLRACQPVGGLVEQIRFTASVSMPPFHRAASTGCHPERQAENITAQKYITSPCGTYPPLLPIASAFCGRVMLASPSYRQQAEAERDQATHPRSCRESVAEREGLPGPKPVCKHWCHPFGKLMRLSEVLLPIHCPVLQWKCPIPS